MNDPAEACAVAPSLRGFSRDARAYAQMREHLSARIEALNTPHRAPVSSPNLDTTDGIWLNARALQKLTTVIEFTSAAGA